MTKGKKSKSKETRAGRMTRLIPSLALSVFGSVGLVLLLVINGLFEEDLAAVSKNLASGYPFVILAWVWLFSGVFITTKVLEPSAKPRPLVETFLTVNSFLTIFVSGFICMYWCVSFVSWWWLITITVLGGSCGIFHGWFIYFSRTRTAIDSALLEMKEAEIFVKSLELEHNFFQSYGQQLASAAAIFITAGVVGYYIRGEQVSTVSLINACLMVTWLIVGLFFGIFIPIQKHLEYIRHTVRDIALHKHKKQ